MRLNVVEIIVPKHLGRDYRWLLASSWVTNIGDGIALAAGPLLVASQTDEAFLVALAATVQWLPPLLFGLYAGALSDRLNRRTIVLSVNIIRVVVLTALALAVATDAVSIVVVLVSLFALGTAEVFADNTSGTLVPMLVHRDDLAIANARIQAGFITVNQMAGPPLGALLFALGYAFPFVTQATLVLAGVLLVSRVAIPPSTRAPESLGKVRHDVAEGFRFVVRTPAVRTLVLTGFAFCLMSGAGWSVLVIYASERLGLGAVGFGLLTTVGAVGGLLGTTTYGWLTRRFSLASLMRVGLVVETFTHLALALTTIPWVAMVVFFFFGAHDFVWGTTSTTIRQRVVPTELQGRVGSVNLVGVYGGLVLGSAIGGVVAQTFGVAAPFWMAFVGAAVFVILVWRQLHHLSAEPAEQAAVSPA